MSFYSGLKTLASTLLRNRGQQVTFSREQKESFDPKTGKTQSGSLTYTGYGASFAYNTKEIDGSIIQIGDIRFLLEATTTAPKLGDTTTIDNIGYRIMAIEPLSPAGIVVLYQVQLRR